MRERLIISILGPRVAKDQTEQAEDGDSRRASSQEPKHERKSLLNTFAPAFSRPGSSARNNLYYLTQTDEGSCFRYEILFALIVLYYFLSEFGIF